MPDRRILLYYFNNFFNYGEKYGGALQMGKHPTQERETRCSSIKAFF
jgi:hypothetical protein